MYIGWIHNRHNQSWAFQFIHSFLQRKTCVSHPSCIKLTLSSTIQSNLSPIKCLLVKGILKVGFHKLQSLCIKSYCYEYCNKICMLIVQVHLYIDPYIYKSVTCNICIYVLFGVHIISYVYLCIIRLLGHANGKSSYYFNSEQKLLHSE